MASGASSLDSAGSSGEYCFFLSGALTYVRISLKLAGVSDINKKV